MPVNLNNLDPELLARARELANDYRLVLDKAESGGFVATAQELPRIFGEGQTPDDCVRVVRQALTAAVAAILHSGQVPPFPRSRRIRNEQINLRVTAEEKSLLENAANDQGFRGVSDYVRTRVLDSIQAAGRSHSGVQGHDRKE